MDEPQTALEEWKRCWPTVLAAMVGMSFYTVITYSLGTFIRPLEAEFGWSRAEMSFGLTIFGGIAMLGGPLVGLAIDRFGSRRIAICGTALTAATFSAFSLANGSLGQWFALYAMYGLFALATKSTVWAAGISSVFTRSRSLALSVVLSGSAIGQWRAPAIANWLIETRGWRSAYFWLGLGWGGLALVLVLLFYFDAHARRARTASSQPAGSEAPRRPILPGLTIREACRDTRVIRIAVANLFMSTVGAGVSVHMVPIIAEKGITMDAAVEMAGLAGLAGLVGKLGVGWLLDRVQGSVIPFVSFAVGGLGHFLLMGTLGTHAALSAGAMCLGFSSGAGLQVSTYLVSRYAGLKNFGAIFGVIASMMMAGTAIGPWIAGTVHDVTGTYDGLLMVASPVMLLTALLFVGLGAYPVFAGERPVVPPMPPA